MTERADRLHHDKCACPFHSSRAGLFFCMVKHQITQSFSPLQPRISSLRLLAFPTDKIAVERDEICECDSHTVRKLSQWRLTADWLAPRESYYSRVHSKVSSDWLPSYIKPTRPLLEIFKMAGYFPDSPHTRICFLMDLNTNSDYFTTQHEMIRFYEEVLISP
jgi:hypothetical protein